MEEGADAGVKGKQMGALFLEGGEWRKRANGLHLNSAFFVVHAIFGVRRKKSRNVKLEKNRHKKAAAKSLKTVFKLFEYRSKFGFCANELQLGTTLS